MLDNFKKGVLKPDLYEPCSTRCMPPCSTALGVDQSNVSKLEQLARLPEDVVAAFRTPLDLQQGWARHLAEAVQKDPEGILARAKAIAARPIRPSAKQIFNELLGVDATQALQLIELKKDGKTVATIRRKGVSGLAVDLLGFSELGAAESAVRRLLKI